MWDPHFPRVPLYACANWYFNPLCYRSRGMNFNFPTKKGTGVERLLPHGTVESIDLIYKLCTYDPDERMTAKQALKHSYFKELR